VAGVFLGVLLVQAFDVPLAAPPGNPAPDEIQGRLELRFNDCSDPEAKGPRTTYVVRDHKTHRATELEVGEEAVKGLKLGRTVRVKGSRKVSATSGRGIFTATSVSYESATPGSDTGGAVYTTSQEGASAVAAGAPTTVELKCLLLFGNALNYTYPSNTIVAVTNKLFASAQNVSEWMKSATLGHCSLKFAGLATINLGYNATGVSKYTLEDDIRNGAIALGYNMNDYDRVLILCPSGAAAFTAYAYSYSQYSIYSWNFVTRSFDGFAHELGHNFGLMHSAVGGDEYADTTCVMGYSHYDVNLAATYCAVKKDQLNWFAPYAGGSTSLTADATIELYPDAQNPDAAPGVRVVRLAGTDYYISYTRYLTPYGWLYTASDADKVYVRTSTSIDAFSYRVAGLTAGTTYTAGSTAIKFEIFGNSSNSCAAVSFDLPDGNTKPVANAQSVNALAAAPLAITLSGSDANSDPLTYSIYIPPTNGTLSGSGSNLTYTANAGYAGSDSFVFRVDDGKISSFAKISIAVLSPPAVNNGSGASALQSGVSRLSGTLSTGTVADVRIYWGTSDGGTNAAGWGQELLLANVVQGAFSANASNLIYGVQYYYRCYASNSMGTAWAPATTNFTSVAPSVTAISNMAATAVGTHAATLNARLNSTGAVYNVYAHWNTVNGGTNVASWTNEAYLGTWTNSAATNLSFAATNLTPGTTYYFTFRGSNACGQTWAANVQSFITVGQPAVDNGSGASALQPGVSRLSGTLSAGSVADVRIYWGTSDGGTNAAGWDQTILLANVAQGAFSDNANNLLYGVQYYYRCYASNSMGTAWAPATTNFTSLAPFGSGGALPSSGGWTPSNLVSGVALWLDASDTNTVQLNGSSVTNWLDKSGNGRNFSQGNATYQPAYSNPNISLDGSNDGVMRTAGNFGYGTGDFAILAVVKPTARNGTYGSEIVGQHAYGSGADFIFHIAPGGQLRYKRGGGTDVVTSGGTVALNTNSVVSVSRTSNNHALHINGTQDGTAVDANSIGNTLTTGIGVANNYNAGSAFSGQINEILIVSSTLTTSDRQKVEGYLAWKWGMQTNLPSDHPYKLGPPSARGGVVTYTDSNGLNPTNTPYANGYVVHTFYGGSDTFSNTTATSVDVLVVGGGGGGGCVGTQGGGGGAGGVTNNTAYAVVAGSNYNVTVGAGGLGGKIGTGARNATSGSNSVFGAITALGGGNGAGNTQAAGSGNGVVGSGGGGAYNTVRGTGTPGQGNDGGAGQTSANYGQGGGGGAGSNGQGGSASYGGGGGTGLYFAAFSSWGDTNHPGYFAGGGGGSYRPVSGDRTICGGAGGWGGGGIGGDAGGSITNNGQANTGGGGGGADYNTGGNVTAGSGGSGIVIVRYRYGSAGTATVLSNTPATAVEASNATLNATLACPGAVYSVYAHWNTVNGGKNAAAWTNSAYVGTWTNAAATNLAFIATGLTSGTPYYFTFRGSNAVDQTWATNVLAFTTSGAVPPVAAFTVAPTNGYAPLRAVFTDSSTGTITNRHWAFGDGNTFDTVSQVSVTNLYTSAGVYVVSLTVTGPGGTATNTQPGLIGVQVVPPPEFVTSNGQVMSVSDGAWTFTVGGVEGLQYRLVYKDDLTSTGAAWQAVTPPFPNGWTNGGDGVITLQDPGSTVVPQRFYRLESKSLSAP
jgi:hypothetical protein